LVCIGRLALSLYTDREYMNTPGWHPCLRGNTDMSQTRIFWPAQRHGWLASES